MDLLAEITRFRFGGDDHESSDSPQAESPLPSLSPRRQEYSHQTEIDGVDETFVAQQNFINDLVKAWQERNVQEIHRLTNEHSTVVQDLFDPDKTSSLVSFIACQGIDVVATLLLDADEFPLTESTAAELPHTINLFIRIFTEIIIVNNSFAWYFFDAHQDLLQFLIQLVHISTLQENILTFLEHCLATVGPAIDISTTPSFIKAIETASNGGLAFVSRVVALLIVSGGHAVTPAPSFLDPPTYDDWECFDEAEEQLRNRQRHTYHLSLYRSQQVEKIIDRNTRVLMAVPDMIGRLVALLKFARQSDRRGGMQIMFGNGGAVDFAQLQGALTQLLNMGGGDVRNNQATAMLAAGFGGALGVPDAFDSDYDSEDDDYGNEVGTEAGVQFSTDGQPPVIVVPMQNQDENGTPPSVGDSADCRWFNGAHQNAQDWWRLRPLVVEGSSPTPARSRFLQWAAAGPMNAVIRNPMESHTIINALSEVLFVLNSLICTPYHQQVWRDLNKAKILQTLRDIFQPIFEARRSSSVASSGSNHGVSGVANNACTNNTESSSLAAAGARHLQDEICSPKYEFDLAQLTDSEDDEDDGHHSHDSDTLRKIELLRLLHEFWDAHDVNECVRSNRVDAETMKAKNDLMRYIVDVLKSMAEDVCVDNLICYALEAYIRCHWFRNRMEAQTIVAEDLLPTLLERLLASRSSSETLKGGSRRLESTFTLIAELCKFHPTNWRRVDQLVISMCKTTKMRKKILKYGFHSNFFVRSVLLSCFPQLRSREALQITLPQLIRNCEIMEAKHPGLTESDACIPSFEVPSVVMQRLHYVRHETKYVVDHHSLVDDLEGVLSRMAEAPSIPSLKRDSEKAEQSRRRWHKERTSMCELATDDSRDACITEQATTQTRWTDPTVCCVPPIAKSNLDQTGVIQSDNSNHSHTNDEVLSDFFECLEQTSFVAAVVLHNPAKIIWNLVTLNNPDTMESTDQLCAITTAMIFFMCLQEKGGIQLVGETIQQIKAVHKKERKAWTKQQEQKRAQTSQVQKKRDETQRQRELFRSMPLVSAVFPEETGDGIEMLTKPVPHETIPARRPIAFTVDDVCKSMYRMFCVWFAHYVCQERYFHTLFFCTQIDVSQWHKTLRMLLKILPKYFDDAVRERKGRKTNRNVSENFCSYRRNDRLHGIRTSL